MNCTEIITATGKGTWYLVYEVVLATVTRCVSSKYQPNEKITITYEMRFKKPEEPRWEHRNFETETERTNFIHRSFSELTLTPVAEPVPVSCSHLLSPLVGEHLDSITFVSYYLQLRFNEHLFNCYAWPVIWIENRRFAYGMEGYRDALCALISKVVVRFEEYLDAGLVFEFENGNSIEIPVTDPTQKFEVAEYFGPEGVWNFW